MATNFDKVIGWSMVSLAVTIFAYYTLWVIVLPFIEPHEKIHSFFLPRYYAAAIPLTLMVVTLIIIGITVAAIMTTQKLKFKLKKE